MSTSSSITPNQPPFLIALSGPSSSGKTTIAHLLARIFSSPSTTNSPNDPFPAPPRSQIITHLLHADDFYRPDSTLPIHASTGYRNWDCAAALDLPKLENVLRGLKERTLDIREVGQDLKRQGEWDGGGASGSVEQAESKQDGDGVHAPSPAQTSKVREAIIHHHIAETQAWLSMQHPQRRTILIIDGFLLLGGSIPPTLLACFDTRILLRARFSTAKARREARNRYVTLDGFWEDPPGYFEQVVWEGYVAEHGWLFREGDVEGEVEDDGDERRQGVRVGAIDAGLEKVLGWCVKVVREGLAEEGKRAGR